MNSSLNRIFRLRPGEFGLIFVLGLVLLLNSVAVQVSGIVSISNFLSEGGVNYLLIVWIVDDLLILLTAGLQTLVVDRFDRIKLMRWMTLGFAAVFIILRLMFLAGVPGWLNYSLLYLAAEQQELFVPLVFWILANDMLNMAQTKRLFPIIASWGLAGRLLGIGVAAISPGLFARLGLQTEAILILNILVYLAAFLVITGGLRRAKISPIRRKRETVRETLTEGWGFMREVLSFRYLMLAIVALSVADIAIGFHFYVVSDQAFGSPDSYQRFLSLYRLGVTIAAIIVQAFITSRIIKHTSVQNALLILPFAVLAGLSWMIALPGLLSSTGGLVLQRLTSSTVDESAKKSLQALVPEERRGRVSMFMDSYLPSTGTILGAAITGLIVLTGIQAGLTNYFYIYLTVGLLAALFAIWAIFKMGSVYDVSLLNWRLKRRRRASSVLDTGVMQALTESGARRHYDQLKFGNNVETGGQPAEATTKPDSPAPVQPPGPGLQDKLDFSETKEAEEPQPDEAAPAKGRARRPRSAGIVDTLDLLSDDEETEKPPDEESPQEEEEKSRKRRRGADVLDKLDF